MSRKNLIAALAAVAFVVAGGIGAAQAEGGLSSGGSYPLSFTCTDGCSGTYEHTLTVDTIDAETGEFSGTGVSETNASTTWDVTGVATSSTMLFALTYNDENAGYTITGEGAGDENGVFTGTATSTASQEFSFTLDTQVAEEEEEEEAEEEEEEEEEGEETEEEQEEEEGTDESEHGVERVAGDDGTTYRNHGQYVRSQSDKRAAAHSRIGMPVHSKGHKK